MSSTIEIVDTGEAFAQENMDWDERFMQLITPQQAPLLRFYSWKKPSLSFGKLLKVHELVNMQALKELGFDFAIRPSGGGVVFHHLSFSFSFFLPSTHWLYALPNLERYLMINAWTRQALDSLGFNKIEFGQEESLRRPDFCMARPTIYDLLVHGRKIGGSAQRKSKKALLHQGVIVLLAKDLVDISSVFCDRELYQKTKSESSGLLEGIENALAELGDWKRRLRSALTEAFSRAMNANTLSC